MKLLKLFSLVLSMSMFILSCKKDFDYTDRPSHGSLQGASGECLPKNIHGVFKKGVSLTSNNYIDVHVNIDSVGRYDIRTDTVNGYSFRGVGTLGVKGDNMVRLYGSGNPLSGGNNTFMISYSGTFCTVSVPVEGAVTPPAAFTFGSTAGVCSGATVNGTYATGLAVGTDNKAVISVNVTTVGTYSITSSTVNGITFSKSGSFTTTGVQNVTLAATGTPVAATTNNHTLTAGASSCTFSVTAVTISDAVFALGGAGSTCSGGVAAGTYAVGTALTTGNTLSIQVNVTTPGTYTISSNTVNGISFAKTGVFSATGNQPVVLTGTGIPTAAGTFSYTVSAGSSNCTFAIAAISGTPPVVNADYYPLTQGSYWTYDEVYTGSTNDTLKLAVNGNGTFSGNSYAKMITTFIDDSKDTTYSRKSGTEYHAWTYTDQFTSAVYFDEGQFADIIFLKEGPTGTTWTTPTYTGVESGVSMSLKYIFTIANGNTSLTVNGVAFNNVIKVVQQTQVSISGTPFTTIETVENYYAKGVGLISSKIFSVGSSTPDDELKIRYYHVN